MFYPLIEQSLNRTKDQLKPQEPLPASSNMQAYISQTLNTKNRNTPSKKSKNQQSFKRSDPPFKKGWKRTN